MKKGWAVAILLIAACFCVVTFDNDLFSNSSTRLVPFVNQDTVSLSPSLQAEAYSNCAKELEQKLNACSSIYSNAEKCQCSSAALEQFQACSPSDYEPDLTSIPRDSSLFEEITKLVDC